ncbi:mannose-6-phosphate isomerase, class I [Lutimonas sp.]|uniref:mannose-6-phosphate isomerase, class I n=1 Tax=Lutimonas sp. TaxID=1872403 RepID=UPI003D9B93F9
MLKIFSLKGQVQNYAWGGTEFIPDLLEMKTNGTPVAEYWLGAHNKAPSTVAISNSHMDLIDFIDQNPRERLGAEIYQNFGRLPFLFKVLDVYDMLSIQVHPTKTEAEKGYKLENEKGIDLHATFRNYKDDNHKPEIMVALGEFWLLHGFAPPQKLFQTLQEREELSFLVDVFKKEGYKGMYSYVMNLSSEENNQILKPLIDRIMPLYKEGKLNKKNPDFWAAKAVSVLGVSNGFDKGIYSIYFFNVLKLQKGEGVFQDAGVPHAYLEGQNIELMANSDNVLRGGLTPKHIDIAELLKHVAFEETRPIILEGTLLQDGLERVYSSVAPDFQLSEITLKTHEVYTHEAATIEIYLLIEGEAKVVQNNASLELRKGEAFMVVANGKIEISTNSQAVMYKATTP